MTTFTCDCGCFNVADATVPACSNLSTVFVRCRPPMLTRPSSCDRAASSICRTAPLFQLFLVFLRSMLSSLFPHPVFRLLGPDLLLAFHSHLVHVSKHTNSGRTWKCCRKVNNTTFPTSFYLRVGKHQRLIAKAKLCCNAILQRMFLELFDPSSDSQAWPYLS